MIMWTLRNISLNLKGTINDLHLPLRSLDRCSHNKRPSKRKSFVEYAVTQQITSV